GLRPRGRRNVFHSWLEVSQATDWASESVARGRRELRAFAPIRPHSGESGCKAKSLSRVFRNDFFGEQKLLSIAGKAWRNGHEKPLTGAMVKLPELAVLAGRDRDVKVPGLTVERVRRLAVGIVQNADAGGKPANRWRAARHVEVQVPAAMQCGRVAGVRHERHRRSFWPGDARAGRGVGHLQAMQALER